MGLLIVFYAKIITCGVSPSFLEEICTVNFLSSLFKKPKNHTQKENM